MAFYMSPLVKVIETDLSDVIPSVSTSVGMILLRNTKKGPELKRKLITNVDELIDTFGETTDNALASRDLLSAMGFLLQGNQLYCTRVLTDDATFAGTRIVNDGSFADFDSPFTLNDFPSEDPDNFNEDVIVDEVDDALWVIASSRGDWGNDIRLSICNKEDFDSIRMNQIPSGWTVPASAEESTYWSLNSIDTQLANDKEFLVVVETKIKGGGWSISEYFDVSTDENDLDDQGRLKYVETIINQTSQNIRVNLTESLKNNPWTVSTEEYVYLKDGSLGTNLNDLISNLLDALSIYDNAEDVDINMVIDSDKPIEVKKSMIDLCESRMDCMAVLDCPMELVVNNRGNETQDLANWRLGLDTFINDNLNRSTSYASLYGNWLEVYDPYQKKYKWTPASGYVAGVYARTDDVRDPWWAPAGFRRAILNGRIRKLAFNPGLPKRDLLYKYGINPIVSFAGEGKVVYGQKTMLSRSSAFNRINVRRLFITIEKAISTSAKYFLFEPNDPITRLQIVDLITPYLRDVKARRGIYEFDVICDERNNSSIRIDRNELHAAIMIQPTRAAEFIVLNFVATATGASFDEAFKAI